MVASFHQQGSRSGARNGPYYSNDYAPSGRMGRHLPSSPGSVVFASNGAISSGTALTERGTSKTRIGQATQVEREPAPEKENLRTRGKEQGKENLVAKESRMEKERTRARTERAKASEGTYRRSHFLACGNMTVTVG